MGLSVSEAMETLVFSSSSPQGRHFLCYAKNPKVDWIAYVATILITAVRNTINNGASRATCS